VSPGLWFALCGLAGAAAGMLNAFLTAYGTHRLLEGRRVSLFVLSSLLRIGLFAILPVALAMRVPSPWTIASFFGGFFTPLALYAILLGRTLKRKT